MPKPLIFMMGRSPAFVATDREYAPNHMWIQPAGDVHQVGFSAYAVKLLGDLNHLQWSIREGDAVVPGMPIGLIEGSKATSDLYSPMEGVIAAFNPEVVRTPSLINSNLYDEAWLFQLSNAAGSLLSPERYVRHLEASWPLAERLLKGHAGR